MTEEKKKVNPILVLVLIMSTAIGSTIVWQQVIQPSLANFEERRVAAAELPYYDGNIIASEHCVISDIGERTCEPVTCYVQTNGDLYCKRN